MTAAHLAALPALLAENPLLGHHDVIPYHLIRAEHVEPAIEHVIQTNLRQLAQLLPEQLAAPTWEGLVKPLEDMHQRLLAVLQPEQLLSRHQHLAVIDAYARCRDRVQAYELAIKHNRTVHAVLQLLQQSPQALDFDPTQQAALNHALRASRLAGVGTQPSIQKRIGRLQMELAGLYQTFADNLSAASEAGALAFDNETALAGIAPAVLASMALCAREAGQSGWRLPLELPLVLAVLSQAHDRALREQVYRAFYTQASEQGPQAGTYDNGPVLQRILAARAELAEAGGYRSYASLAQATRMFDEAADVEQLLLQLIDKVRPAAQAEFAPLQELAALFGVPALQPWDCNYYQEKYLQIHHGVTELKVREYFPVQAVLDGLQRLLEQLFDVQWLQCPPAPRQPASVHLIQLSEQGQVLGHIYLDLHTRPKKRAGAWMEALRDRHRFADGRLQLPIAHVGCDFAADTPAFPCLLSLGDIQTFFHELGHALHHVLTRIDHGSVSGIKGVAEDAVELPSGVFEHWAMQPEVLQSMSRHHRTGEAIGTAFVERALAAQARFRGQALLWQLEYALVDYRLHSHSDTLSARQIGEQVLEQTQIVRHPPYVRWLNTFAHLFTGADYAAGYYSYVWAQVLAAHLFARFKREGLFSSQVGGDFERLILASGGTRPFAELVESFAGSEAGIEALLLDLGIKT
ncbi:M3 family metallopeptidase [Pseudomonas sp. CFBP 8771]|uniref:M3 family metallopeptidase n=1 Tax=Pseudomonas sp. CFBP 8771 TaxID=2775285 RepID=UPI0017815DF1|nr:M3 family metallopeptidase [Pseudomonas sp. CFBP 8771]MBD8603892.1 M3 family metallopeptidase [Pseudomonas sp. CFBP 8771]